jgi:hypothetical protein
MRERAQELKSAARPGRPHVADHLRTEGFDRRRRGEDWCAHEESSELRTVVAGAALWLSRLLRPSHRRGFVGWLELAAFAAIALLLSSPILVTDLPGHIYAVAYFGFVSLVVVLVPIFSAG